MRINPANILESGAYYWKGKDNNGRRQDEFARIGNLSIWAYHGIPIASFDHETREFKRSNGGYETSTTKERLNHIPGPGIFQRNFTWYTGDYKNPTEWENENLGISIGGYHKIDGWRGYSFPCFAVAGASNTGNWSDSPARPETVESEFAELSSILKKSGIQTYTAWTETSNVFCIKNWLCIPGNRYTEARSIVDPILSNNFGRVAHSVD